MTIKIDREVLAAIIAAKRAEVQAVVIETIRKWNGCNVYECSDPGSNLCRCTTLARMYGVIDPPPVSSAERDAVIAEVRKALDGCNTMDELWAYIRNPEFDAIRQRFGPPGPARHVLAQMAMQRGREIREAERHE